MRALSTNKAIRPARALTAFAFIAALSAGHAAEAAPLFKDATPNLGSPQPCYDGANPGLEGCYTHYVIMADLDGDRDLDLIFAAGGGYYVPAGTAPLIAYLNDGKGMFSLASSAFGDFQGRTRQIAVGDVDADGDLDVYVPQGYGKQADAIQDAFFINDGMSPPHFTDESAKRLPITSRAGATRFGDVDGDGDLDLVVTDWGDAPPMSAGTAHLYLNDGQGVFGEKLGAVPMDTSSIGTGPIDVDFFDADGDLDLDMMFASRVGSSLLFINDGTGAFTNAPIPKQPGPYVYGPDECDVDGDGDLDIWLDNGAAGHTEQLLINDGKATFTDETAARVTGNPKNVDDNEVQCVDVDGDGDFDAVIASLSNYERVLLNDGTGHFKLDPGTFPMIMDSTLGLDLGDVDGDHILDAVTAQGESQPFLNRLYLGIAPAPADVRAPAFRKVEQIAAGTLAGKTAIRFAVTDNATTDEGPRLLKAYVEVQGAASAPATFLGGDLFRAEIDVPADGAIVYHACAIDWAGNKSCSPDIAIEPADAGASTSTSTSSGAGGASSTTTASASSAGPSSATGGEALTGGACSCAIPGKRSGSSTGLALFAGAIATAIARRRHRRRW